MCVNNEILYRQQQMLIFDACFLPGLWHDGISGLKLPVIPACHQIAYISAAFQYHQIMAVSIAILCKNPPVGNLLWLSFTFLSITNVWIRRNINNRTASVKIIIPLTSGFHFFSIHLYLGQQIKGRQMYLRKKKYF